MELAGRQWPRIRKSQNNFFVGLGRVMPYNIIVTAASNVFAIISPGTAPLLVAAHHHRHRCDDATATAPLPFNHGCLCASYNLVWAANEFRDSAMSYKGYFSCRLERHGVRYHYLRESTTDFRLQGLLPHPWK